MFGEMHASVFQSSTVTGQHPEKFWLVACTDTVGYEHENLTRPPKYVHRSAASAEKEALRLALKTGNEFSVLEALASISVRNGQPFWQELTGCD